MDILRRLFVWLSLLVLVLAGLGCASSRRMLEVSVFGEGNERLTDKRVNLFPLYYANREKHSVLWPVGDWDDHGFAIRPLINKQDEDYSVLFPLSSWNTKDGDGWALTSWWDKQSFGLLPIGGKGRDWWFAGPLVRSDTLSKDPGTALVPVAYWDKESCWVLNSWWSKDSKGFLPVFAKGRTWWAAGPWLHFEDGANFVLPVAYWDRHTLWLGEIFYGKAPDSASGYAKWRSMFGLMAFGETTAKGREWWALPLLTYHNRQGENLTHVSFPLWWQSDSAQAHSRTLFPLWHQQSNMANGFSCWVTPLAGYGGNPAADTHLINLFGPLYWDYRDPQQRIINVAGLYNRIGDAHYGLFGLGKVQVNAQGTTWRAWPFACGAEGPGMSGTADGYLQVSSLYWHGANDKKSSWHFWPLMAWGEHTPTYQDSNFLFGSLGDMHQTDAAEGSSRVSQRRLVYRTEQTRPLPGAPNWSWLAQAHGSVVTSDTLSTLLTHHERQTHQQLPQGTRPADEAWIGLGHWLMCPQGPGWKTDQDIPWQWSQNTRRAELPLDAKSHTSRAVPYPSARDVRATLATLGVKNLPAATDLAATGTRPQDRKRLEQALRDSAITWNTSLRRLDPLIPLWQRSEEREGDGQAVKDEALWGLLWDYKRNPSESSFRLLWRMYERQQEGQGKQATVRRNIFPFLRWDSSPDKSHVSLLWNMVDWHTSKDKNSGGHLLFIPWGHDDG